jgi:GxxExxY protein
VGTFHHRDPSNPLTSKIIGAAITVHRQLGPGLLESAYEACLAAELRHGGLRVARQVPVPLVYRDVRLDVGYRMDLLVEDEVVVELKVVSELAPVHTSQVLSYLRLSGLRAGLLFNFNTDALAAGGIRRILSDA